MNTYTNTKNIVNLNINIQFLTHKTMNKQTFNITITFGIHKECVNESIKTLFLKHLKRYSSEFRYQIDIENNYDNCKKVCIEFSPKANEITELIVLGIKEKGQSFIDSKIDDSKIGDNFLYKERIKQVLDNFMLNYFDNLNLIVLKN